MSRPSWNRRRSAIGIGGSLALYLFAACSDDAAAVDAPDGGPSDSPLPVHDAGSVDAANERREEAGVELQCGEDGFCLTVSPSASSPAGQAVNLNDVWLDPDGHAWAVGYRADGMGLIVVYDGAAWKVAWSGRGSLSAIWGVSRDEIWATGGDMALHGISQGGTFGWTAAPFPNQSFISSVWAAGPSDVWACGGGGIFHWTGSSWTASLARGSSFYEYRSCGDIWGTETGEVWATVQHTTYDPEIEDYRYEMYLDRRPAGGAGGDAGSEDETEPGSTDGWRIAAGTRSNEFSYGSGWYAGSGVHWVVGRVSGRIGVMRSQRVGERAVFGPFAAAVDSAGTLLSGSNISDIWGTPNEAWGVGTLGVYHYDGASWALARTSMGGLPLAAIGQPTSIFGDPNQVFVVGYNIALRRDQVTP